MNYEFRPKAGGFSLPPGDYQVVMVEQSLYEKTIGKRWHLSSTQLGIVLGTTGGFWLLVGIFIAVRFLLTWGCMGTWR